nr:unnamed protein product [Digitaria exilis]
MPIYNEGVMLGHLLHIREQTRNLENQKKALLQEQQALIVEAAHQLTPRHKASPPCYVHTAPNSSAIDLPEIVVATPLQPPTLSRRTFPIEASTEHSKKSKGSMWSTTKNLPVAELQGVLPDGDYTLIPAEEEQVPEPDAGADVTNPGANPQSEQEGKPRSMT